jgi:hypothetical protein
VFIPFPTSAVGNPIVYDADVCQESTHSVTGMRPPLIRHHHYHQAGQGGRVNVRAGEAQGQMLEENICKLQGIEANLAAAREALAESRSHRSQDGGLGVAACEAKLRLWMEQQVNHGDVVLRQKSILGLWSPPSRAFLAAEIEVKRLEARRQMLGA